MVPMFIKSASFVADVNQIQNEIRELDICGDACIDTQPFSDRSLDSPCVFHVNLIGFSLEFVLVGRQQSLEGLSNEHKLEVIV